MKRGRAGGKGSGSGEGAAASKTLPLAEGAAGDVELRPERGGVVLMVRVLPRASRDAISGVRQGALVVKLTAPPVEGAANAALTRLLGRALGVAPSAVRIVSGTTGRTKRVAVSGVGLAAARERLRDAGAGPAPAAAAEGEERT